MFMYICHIATQSFKITVIQKFVITHFYFMVIFLYVQHTFFLFIKIIQKCEFFSLNIYKIILQTKYFITSEKKSVLLV